MDPAKTTRTIVVDGVRYRWSLRRSPSLVGTWIEVEPFTGGATLLIARSAGWGLGRRVWAFSPNEVASAIRRALAGGWVPHARGVPFVLRR